MRARTFSSYDLLHMHPVCDTVALAASCCVRPTMAQSYGKLISQIVLSLGGLWSESGWVLYDLSRENYKSCWVTLGQELREEPCCLALMAFA